MKKLFFAIFSSRRSAGPEFTAQSRIGFTFMAPLPASRQITNEPIIAPHPISAPGRTREGFGGEKAAGKAASLPVPTTHRTPHRPSIAVQQSLRSASGEVEQKREWVFPQKSGKSRSRFCGSPCRPRPGNEKSGIYADRAPRGDCDHRDSGGNAAPGAEPGAFAGTRCELPQ